MTKTKKNNFWTYLIVSEDENFIQNPPALWLAVSGDTYGIKEELREYGFEWKTFSWLIRVKQRAILHDDNIWSLVGSKAWALKVTRKSLAKAKEAFEKFDLNFYGYSDKNLIRIHAFEHMAFVDLAEEYIGAPEIKEARKPEFLSGYWNGKVYAGKSIYVDDKKVDLTDDMLKELDDYSSAKVRQKYEEADVYSTAIEKMTELKGKDFVRELKKKAKEEGAKRTEELKALGRELAAFADSHME